MFDEYDAGRPDVMFVIQRILERDGQFTLMDQNRVLRPNLAGKPGWLNGPAKLTQALGIGRQQNGADVCSEESGLWVERGISVPKEQVRALPRVGIGYAGEPWLSMPWRWVWDADL